MGRQGLSNRKLAALADLKQSNVALKTKGARAMTLDEFCAMSQALSAAPTELLRRAATALGVSASGLLARAEAVDTADSDAVVAGAALAGASKEVA